MPQPLQDFVTSINEHIALAIATIQTKYYSECKLSDSILYSLGTKGRRIRPILFFTICSALNCPIRESFKKVALSLEIMHTASLIHDDIIDHDSLRRGRASVPYKYGIEQALLTGDFLLFYALNVVAGIQDCDTPLVPTMIEHMTDTYCHMCLGQSMEDRLIGGLDNTPEIYLEVIKLKTASFFSMICLLAGILTGVNSQDMQMLARFGECLGIAYQIRDDVLNFCIGHAHQDKNMDSDQHRRLVTLPILLGYRHACQSDRLLLEQHFFHSVFLNTEQLSKILYTSGGMEETLKYLSTYMDEARMTLCKLAPRGDIDLLTSLLDSFAIAAKA